MVRQLAIIALLGLTLVGCSSNASKNEYDSLTAAQIFEKGQKNLKTHRYTTAIEDFDALEARFPYGEYADKAQLATIFAYYETEEPESALAATERFIQIHPRHEHVDYAYYMKGLIKFSESMTSFDRYLPLERAERDISSSKEAFFHFDELIARFPNSRYVSDARQRMVFLKNTLAEHHIHVAGHYFERGAFLASANRAIEVIEQFGDTPSKLDALRMMIKSYEAMGLTQLAEDTKQILALNQA